MPHREALSAEVIEEGRLRTNPEAFRRRFSSEQRPLRIVIEAGTHSPWASRVLKECGHEVLVANARKLRFIYANKRKSDELDVENLARLTRVDPKLSHPLKHRSEDSQAHIAITKEWTHSKCGWKHSARRAEQPLRSATD